MCGIAGVLHFDGHTAVRPYLQRMTDTIQHRGPDGEGFFVDGPVGLGHRRLAIIDLSEAGKQPMSNTDGTLYITYNGELYNFQEIRRQLEAQGHRFRSATDTEVVLHAYEEWGTECLGRFNGMFAFAIWDGRRQRLWLARDRLGIKPLFYARLQHRFLFGSEIKALLSDTAVPRQLDLEALAYYLASNYTPAPFTLFAQVRQLLPGHHLMITPDGQVTDAAYWDVTYQEDVEKSETAWREAFSELLADAVRVRLVSDVPFGAFLSGGVDSSAVAYWMAQHLPEPVKTFSIGFHEDSYDETGYARQVAQIIQSDHHEKMVTADAAQILPRLVWHAEEPTADSSMVAVYYLAQMSRQHVTMALSGDGADEILAGYETYQAHYLHHWYRKLPPPLRQRLLAPLVKALPVSDSKVSWEFKLKRFINAGDLTGEDAHATWRTIFAADARRELLAPIWHQAGAKADVLDLYRAAFARTNARHPLNRMLYVDTRHYLPNDMLVKVDRMTMAHGLEARVPFLDHRLVAFAATVPPHLKLKQFRHKKYLLKTSLAGKLPAGVLWRKKAGFNVPTGRWMKEGLRPFVLDHLSAKCIKEMGILEETAVARLLQDHFDNKADNSHQIWCLLNLSLWWQQFMR